MMANVSDYIGQSYQRYSTGARFRVPEDAEPPYDPGLVESNAGEVFYLRSDGELIDVTKGSTTEAARGGLATVRTDANGQATVTFPESFEAVPGSVVLTPVNVIVVTGVLVLTDSEVTIFVWDVVLAAWYANRDIELRWVAVL